MTDSQPKKHSDNRPLHILFETGEGRSASAILENAFLKHCLTLGAEVHVLSPGACFKPFMESYQLPGTTFSYFSAHQAQQSKYPRLSRLEASLGNKLSRLGLKRSKHWLWKLFGSRIKAADAVSQSHLLDEIRPDCFVTASVNQGFSRGLISMCSSRGIPTLGNIFSWDHPFYPQPSRPDKLTCWSKIVQDNLISIGGFLPEQIKIIGTPLFDSYFDPEGIWTRQELCDHLGLDPDRPILLFATLGQMHFFLDETHTFRTFLKALDKSNLPGPPQIILRLHPISVDHYFDEFKTRKDIIFSRYTRYCPNMRWWPSREEMFLAGNLLRHADVCISPGSTMTIEAAIFDTPTIVPTFNPIISEEYDQFFQQNWLKKHFKFLIEEQTIALANSPDELISAISKALADSTWLSKGRQKIRDALLGPLDGKATERLAHAAVEMALQNKTRKKK